MADFSIFDDFPDYQFGWSGVNKEVLDRALSNAPSELVQPLQIVGDGPQLDNLMLFRITRKVLGHDTANFRQAIGDCVSHGMKNACEHLICCQIAMGNIASFRPIFTPYIYGVSRMIGNMMGGGDGSCGIFAAQGVNKYGLIASDSEGIPEYSGEVARSWGRDKSEFEKYFDRGKEHLVQKIAKVENWEQALAAITNLYPITVASDYGFTMKMMRSGFWERQGSWAHQMCCVGIDNGDESKGIEPCAAIMNSWGPETMGEPCTDFRDSNLKWPGGTLRIRKRDFEGMLAQSDSWAISSLSDFTLQRLPDFDIL